MSYAGLGQVPLVPMALPPGSFVDRRSAYDRFMSDHGYSVLIYGSLAVAVALGVGVTYFAMRGKRVKANRRRLRRNYTDQDGRRWDDGGGGDDERYDDWDDQDAIARAEIEGEARIDAEDLARECLELAIRQQGHGGSGSDDIDDAVDFAIDETSSYGGRTAGRAADILADDKPTATRLYREALKNVYASLAKNRRRARSRR